MLFRITFNMKLFVSPGGGGSSTHRVLDAGTGTGIWAVDYGIESTPPTILRYPKARPLTHLQLMNILKQRCVTLYPSLATFLSLRYFLGL